MPFDGTPTRERVEPGVLDRTLKQHWVDALRSGKYQQIRGSYFARSTGRCAMGVYNQITYGVAGCDRVKLFDPIYGGVCLLDPEYFDRTIHDIIAEMNDDGESFAEIADWIERNL